MARPPKLLDASVKTKLIKAIKAGATHELACLYAGIGVSTFYDWKARGELAADGDDLYIEFVEDIKSAEGAGAIEILEKIKAAAKDPNKWQAGAWLLERRYPDMYGKQKVEVNHTGELNIKAYKDFSPAEWDADANDTHDS